MASTPPRRFKAEPYETTSTKGKQRATGEVAETPTPKPRKFAPEPIETSSRHGGGPTKESNGIKAEDAESKVEGQEPTKPRRRFVPQPVETSTRSNRKLPSIDQDEDEVPLLPHERAVLAQDFAETPPRRKFKPQLIETAKRSRRAGDDGPSLTSGDKTNLAPDDVDDPPRSNTRPTRPVTSSTGSSLRLPPMRQGTLHPHNNTRANTRQHSFKVPSLEAIESSESEKSDTPSLSTSHSAGSDTTDDTYKDATRRRESDDERFSGYLLALAARAANKQLRAQAAAAFPNSDDHEPVAHYMDRSSSGGSSSDSRSGTQAQMDRLRQDSEEEQQALAEMQKHGEEILKQKQSSQRRIGFVGTFGPTQKERDPWLSAGVNNQHVAGYQTTPKRIIGGHQRDRDMKQMRKAASPPMLGGDIDFPRCPSPEHARFDITQGSDYLLRNIDNLSASPDAKGLWGRAKKAAEEPPTPSKTPAPRKDVESSKEGGDGGLWGGTCTGPDTKMVKQPSGIVTPRHTPNMEKDDPFAALSMTPGTNAPPSIGRRGPVSPPPSSTNLVALAGSPGRPDQSTSSRTSLKLEIEEQVKAEFNDAFVTQVYNYLSLGYPAIARNYDSELSRISGVTVHELQSDDEMAAGGPKGYIRLGHDEDVTVAAGAAQAAGKDVGARRPGAEVHVDETMCARWRALRLYVHEWGHQMVAREKRLGDDVRQRTSLDPHRAWGLPARRGSWGH